MRPVQPCARSGVRPMSASLHVLPGGRDSTARSDIPPLGQILLAREWVDEGQLVHALALQTRTGARLGDVLAAHGWATAEQIAEALAEQWGMGYADLVRDAPDPEAGNPEDLDVYLRHRIIPWRKVGKLVAYATANPEKAQDALAELQPFAGMAFVVVATPAAIEQAMLSRFGVELAARAAQRTPDQLSVRSLDAVRMGAAVTLGGVLMAALLAPAQMLVLLGLVLLALNLATTATRIGALVAGTGLPAHPKPLASRSPDAPVILADRRPLPKISLLIPLYREAGMLGELRTSLRALDYPPELMDVKLLLESDDSETLAAIPGADLPPWVRPVVMPDGAPRTKPRAMNLALDFCEGDVIGIFDAEDRPDAGQLRAVAEHLRHAPPEVACVQCQLSYFNVRENWITRCFQIEYSIWFDVLLRGFQRLRLPIPLGGTSVYFRRSALMDLDGWDAHNVTEDADLGMRLARRGLKTAVLRSTTEEEANCRMIPWIKQRSRWLKGYLMTWLNHMRNPVRLWRDLGARGFVGLNVLFLGGAVTYLAMPLFWAALVTSILTEQSVYGRAMPDWALNILGVSLVAGQIVMLACAVLALRRRGVLGLIVWVPTLPVYWTLGAVAAWKAVIELFFAPYYWDKTQHGITRQSRPHSATNR